MNSKKSYTDRVGTDTSLDLDNWELICVKPSGFSRYLEVCLKSGNSGEIISTTVDGS